MNLIGGFQFQLEAKRRKAEEAVRRADLEYYTFCVRAERARLAHLKLGTQDTCTAQKKKPA